MAPRPTSQLRGAEMKTRRSVTIVVALALSACLSAVYAPESVAGQKSLIGAWIVDVTFDQPGPPPVRNIVSAGPDGLNINYDPEFGAGHGLWKKIGSREYAIKFLTLIAPGHPFFGEGTITVTATLTLDKDGNTATGPFTTVFDTTLNPITVTGTVVQTRITFGP